MGKLKSDKLFFIMPQRGTKCKKMILKTQKRIGKSDKIKKQSGGKSKSRNCFCLLRRYAFGCSGLRVTGLNAQVTRRSFANACLCFLESLEAGTILFLLPMAAPPKTGFFYSIAEKTGGGKRFAKEAIFGMEAGAAFGGYTENTIADKRERRSDDLQELEQFPAQK